MDRETVRRPNLRHRRFNLLRCICHTSGQLQHTLMLHPSLHRHTIAIHLHHIGRWNMLSLCQCICIRNCWHLKYRRCRQLRLIWRVTSSWDHGMASYRCQKHGDHLHHLSHRALIHLSGVGRITNRHSLAHPARTVVNHCMRTCICTRVLTPWSSGRHGIGKAGLI